LSRLAAALLAALAFAAAPCGATSLQVCEHPVEPTADQKDVLLRFGALVRDTLVASGSDVALVARAGMDLHRLHTRFSHEGVTLRDSPATPWAVRQLYYACEDRRPRLFDEGLSSFVMGTDDPSVAWIALVFLPPDAAATLRRAALDKRQALAVLGANYSANAYAFGVLHQNCNQWVMELLAQAWGDEPPPSGPEDAAAARARAQRWLRAQGYLPTVYTVSAQPMTWVSAVIPWLSNDDHPPEEIAHGRYNVSMPSSIETFVQAKQPGARRVELCQAGRRVVIHEGWDEIADGCVPAPGDRVIELERD
jgi:hypothetical protein